MNKKRARVLGCLVVFVGLSCAGDDHENHHQTAGPVAGSAASGNLAKQADGAEPAGACEWPSDLAPLDSKTRDVCHAARAFLSCEVKFGGVHCASNDFVTCADASEIEYPVKNCKSDCGMDEYVALCGGVGPGAVPAPPENCRRSSFANPGGVVMYCCPCG